MRCRCNAVNPNSSQQTPHNSSPVRAGYGVSFVSLKSELATDGIIAGLYVISWYIGPRYNGIRLYMACGRAFSLLETGFPRRLDSNPGHARTHLILSRFEFTSPCSCTLQIGQQINKYMWCMILFIYHISIMYCLENTFQRVKQFQGFIIIKF